MSAQPSASQIACPACGSAVSVTSDAPPRPTACPLCERPLSSSEVLHHSQWYYSANRQKVGPVTWSQLHTQAIGGHLQPADMVLRAGAVKWVPAGSLPDLFATDRTAKSGSIIEFLLDATAEPRPSPARQLPRRRRAIQVLPWDRQFFWFSVGLAAGAAAVAVWLLFAR